MAALSDAKRLVVKIGSSLLVENGALRQNWLTALAQDIADLHSAGTAVLLVSSGSIALGRAALNLPDDTLTLEQSQAAAAVGQIRLARAYELALAPHNITTAQVLVTLEDSANRRRYLNSRATLEQLLALNVVPIVNENDTVATDEIRYGDNDRLAAQIAVSVGADQLVLLSDVDGFYSGNPGMDKSAKRFDTIDAITSDLEAMAGDAGSGLSKGGMKTKLIAAKTATAAGTAMAITDGTRLNPLNALANGAPATWFTAKGNPKSARRHWIAAMKPKGSVTIDAGATAALERGTSLLPAGVTGVVGNFERGEPVTILAANGEIGIGLIRYDSRESRAIAGHKSGEIEPILGYPGRAALIHRDDMGF